MNLTINNSTSSSATATACDSYTWSVDGNTYTASGLYTNVSTNASGCTHTDTLHLTINSPSSATTSTACDSLVWNGQTYTASGTYTHVIPGASSAEVLITAVDLGYTDIIEIQNVSGGTVDVTGWTVVVCDDQLGSAYSTSASSITQTLSGLMNPGDIQSWNDNSSSSNYWGSNLMFAQDDALGAWVMLLDANGAVMDFVAAGLDGTGSYSGINPATDVITFGGNSYPISSMLSLIHI